MALVDKRNPGRSSVIPAVETEEALSNGDDQEENEEEEEEEECNVSFVNESTGAVYVQQGRYVIPIGENSILLQDHQGGNFTQYFINNNVDDDDNQLDESIEGGGKQILYFADELSGYSQILEGTSDMVEEDDNCEEIVKEEEGDTEVLSEDRVAEDDETVENESLQMNYHQHPQYQYAILKNGKLHLQTLDVVGGEPSGEAENADDQSRNIQEQLEAFQQSISMDEEPTIDLGKITGRNLITGQTVTLDGYFNKLHSQNTLDVIGGKYSGRKRQRSTSMQGSSDGIGNFLNKKVIVGKTLNGKRIVGKILHVQLTGGEKDAESSTDGTDNTTLVPQTNEVLPLETTVAPQPQRILIKKHVLSRENFEYNIGKTLVGLMSLETVSQKLRNKNLIVKLVEKMYNSKTESYIKTVSYVYGRMVNLCNEEDKEEKWTFVLHSDGNDEEVDEPVVNNNWESTMEDEKEVCMEIEENDGQCSDDTFSLTITITLDKCGKKSTKVNMTGQPFGGGTICPMCDKEFKSSIQMSKHWQLVHLNTKPLKCDHCKKTFFNQSLLLKHQKVHMGARLYQCGACLKSFNTAGSLKRHLTVHDPSLRPLECSVCSHRFTDESSLRKHLLIHTGIRAFMCQVCHRSFVNQGDLNFHQRIHDPVKQFKCDVCGREFSRHSNLLRHVEIHRGAAALHRCDICGCSYSFVSSLTRHIVQKHISEQ